MISPPVGGRLQAPSVFTVSNAACTRGGGYFLGHIPGSEVAGLCSTRSPALRNITKFPSEWVVSPIPPVAIDAVPVSSFSLSAGRRKLGVRPVMHVG